MCMLTASYPTRTLQVWEQKIGTLLLSELLRANSNGGNRDGVGLGTTDGAYIKWETHAGNIVFTDEYNSAIQQFINAPLLAHVRAISTGVGAKEGAHPFKVGNILLAHNGTFTNYRQFLDKYQKQINDKNPVDSHVIACILAEKVGTGPLCASHIRETLESTKGSFALLVTDATNRSLWVVTGSNPLYIQRSGPLWLVNTSRMNLFDVSENMAGVAKLLYGKSWKVEPAKRIDEFTINLLARKGLNLIEPLDKDKFTVTTTHTQFRGSSSTYQHHSSYTTTKPISSETARERANWANLIVNLPYMSRLELTLGCFILLEVEWWKAELECLEVLHATLEQMSTESGSPVKEELWEELMRMTNQNAYAAIAEITDIMFPYVLNSVENLRRFTQLIRQKLGGGTCYH